MSCLRVVFSKVGIVKFISVVWVVWMCGVELYCMNGVLVGFFGVVVWVSFVSLIFVWMF